jgi:hypothetical protein
MFRASKKIVGLSILAFGLTIGTAHATTIVINCSTASSPTELTGNIVCSQFSPAFGSLSSISILIKGGISGSITLTNNNSSAQAASGTTTSVLNVGALAGFSFVNPLSSESFTTGPFTLSPFQTLTVSGLSGSGSGTILDTTVFAPYEGAGFFNIGVSTLTELAITGGGGNISAAQATSANGTATVTYTFNTNVPEPATLALLGLGLAALGFVRRRHV